MHTFHPQPLCSNESYPSFRVTVLIPEEGTAFSTGQKIIELLMKVTCGGQVWSYIPSACNYSPSIYRTPHSGLHSIVSSNSLITLISNLKFSMSRSQNIINKLLNFCSPLNKSRSLTVLLSPGFLIFQRSALSCLHGNCGSNATCEGWTSL